jgi:hypothetical protein
MIGLAASFMAILELDLAEVADLPAGTLDLVPRGEESRCLAPGGELRRLTGELGK